MNEQECLNIGVKLDAKSQTTPQEGGRGVTEEPSKIKDVLGRMEVDLRYLKQMTDELGIEPSEMVELLKVRALVGGVTEPHSEVTDEERVAIAALIGINDAGGDRDIAYDDPVLRDFVTWYLVLGMSLKRQSRRELVEITKKAPEEQLGLMDKVKGGLGIGGNK